MSSTSDIEKLFDHFGGNANAYQEIGRENDAHSARTRWPLLVTLDLKQQPIPAIGEQVQARPKPAASEPAASAERQDAARDGTAAVTRAKAPLFARSHRRDIPPVAVAAAAPATPTGASRFGAPEALSAANAAPSVADSAAVPPIHPVQAAVQAASAAASAPPVSVAAVPPLSAPVSSTPLAPLAPLPHVAPLAAVPPLAPAPQVAATSPAASVRATSGTHASTPAWTQAPAPARTFASATSAATVNSAAPATAATATVTPSASILGKMFAPQAEVAPSSARADAGQPEQLHSLFDRLRGTPQQTTATSGASQAAPAADGARASWLFGGPRRS